MFPIVRQNSQFMNDNNIMKGGGANVGYKRLYIEINQAEQMQSENIEKLNKTIDTLRNCSSINIIFCLSNLPCTALYFIEISQYSCENLSCSE